MFSFLVPDSNTSKRWSMCFFLWVAIKLILILLVPSGTVGGLIAKEKIPAFIKKSDSCKVFAVSPIIKGKIGTSL